MFILIGMKELLPLAKDSLRKEALRYAIARIKEMDNKMESNSKGSTSTTKRPRSSFPSSIRKKRRLSSHSCMIDESDDENEANENILNNELSLWYAKEGLKGAPTDHLKTFDLFGYWSELKETFPVLSRVAFRFLAAPVASSFAERMFSSGAIVSSQSSVETIERRIQLSHNSHFLREDYGIVSASEADGKKRYCLNLESKGNLPEEKGDESDDEDVV
jgi:hypothetical protein